MEKREGNRVSEGVDFRNLYLSIPAFPKIVKQFVNFENHSQEIIKQEQLEIRFKYSKTIHDIFLKEKDRIN